MGRASRRKTASLTAAESLEHQIQGQLAVADSLGGLVQQAIDNTIWKALMGNQEIGILDFAIGYKRVTLADKRFGGVAVYKTNTKQLSQIMGKEGTPVPETDVWYRAYDYRSADHPGPTYLIAWCARHKISDIQTAVAFLLMQDRTVVVVRAFGPANGMGMQP